MTDLEDMMVDRDMTYDEARDVLADASDSDEDRYERHRERLSGFAEQEREEATKERRPGVFDLRAQLGRAPTVQEYRDSDPTRKHEQ